MTEKIQIEASVHAQELANENAYLRNRLLLLAQALHEEHRKNQTLSRRLTDLQVKPDPVGGADDSAQGGGN